MKFRWSNCKNFAVVFSANSAGELAANGIAALREYRQHEFRRIHRGEIHRTQNYYERAILHVHIPNRYQPDRWSDVAIVVRAGEMSGVSYREYSLRGGYYEGSGLLLAADEIALTADARELFAMGEIAHANCLAFACAGLKFQREQEA